MKNLVRNIPSPEIELLPQFICPPEFNGSYVFQLMQDGKYYRYEKGKYWTLSDSDKQQVLLYYRDILKTSFTPEYLK